MLPLLKQGHLIPSTAFLFLQKANYRGFLKENRKGSVTALMTFTTLICDLSVIEMINSPYFSYKTDSPTHYNLQKIYNIGDEAHKLQTFIAWWLILQKLKCPYCGSGSLLNLFKRVAALKNCDDQLQEGGKTNPVFWYLIQGNRYCSWRKHQILDCRGVGLFWHSEWENKYSCMQII